MKIKKLISIVVLLAIVLSIFAGCKDGDKDTVATKESQTTDTAMEKETDEPEEVQDKTPTSNDFTKFDTPITITSAIAVKPTQECRFGDTIDNTPYTRWMRDTLGVTLQYKWVLTDADNALGTRIRLALTSGEELPDVLPIDYDTLFIDLIESGQIQTINDSYDKYATERVKYAFDQNSVIWNYVTIDGQKWALPQIGDGFVGDTLMWIRQDWLDTLGLEVPANLEEFNAVLDAFTNSDPDGNGENDTYGVAIGGNNTAPLSNWMADVQFLFGQKQAYEWLEGEDGKLSYGSIDTRTKDVLAVLNEWYEGGYIIPDLISQDAIAASGDFVAGKCGVLFAPSWAGGWPVGSGILQAEEEGRAYAVTPCPIPSGVDGDKGRLGSAMSYHGYVFRNGFEHMEAIFRIWDINYGAMIEDPEYPFALGIGEGYDYVTLDNGEVSWASEDIPGGTVDLGIFLATGNKPPNVMEGPSIYERLLNGEVNTVYEKKMMVTNGSDPLMLNAVTVVFDQMDLDVPRLFVGLPTETMASKWAGLQTMEQETQLKIILGEKPVDYYDEFVADWIAGGGTEITEEVNAWYDSVK